MSAGITFVPWLRRGIGALATDAATPGSRRSVRVGLEVNGGALEGGTELELAGPGDVAAVDPTVFTRRWPAPDSADADPNSLALVELSQPDLPWRFSPGAAGHPDRVMPWMRLVVFEESEVAIVADPSSGRPPHVVVADASTLPRPDDAWAWAHGQTTAFASPGSAGGAVGDSARARLLAPRRMEPGRRYVAVVVPTFEAGRRAALGLPVAGADGLAWSGSERSLELPCLLLWRFGTGLGGDFEALARRLAPARVPAALGRLAIDARHPGAGLPPAAEGLLQIAGPLVPPPTVGAVEAAPTTGDDAVSDAFSDALRALLLQGASGDVIAPPLYGRDGPSLAGPDSLAGWLGALNLDARARAVAGLGADVVSGERARLVAEAWASLGDYGTVAESARRLRLSIEVSGRLHARFIKARPLGAVARVAGLVADRVRDGSASIAQMLRAHPNATEISIPAWRRLARPLGPTAARLAKRGTSLANVEKLVTAPAAARPRPPKAMALFDSPRDVAPKNHRPVLARPGAHAPTLGDRSEEGDPRAFSLALRALADSLPRRRPPQPPPPAADPARLARRLDEALEPRRAIAASWMSRLSLGGAVRRDGEEVDALLASPVFDFEPAERLASAHPERFLPGAEALAADGVVAVAVNQPFVEAFLAGANDVLRRELVWSGFPLDPEAPLLSSFWGGDAPADVSPPATWAPASELGSHRPPGPMPFVIVIRGELFARYPDTRVYLARARFDGAGRRTVGSEERPARFEGGVAGALRYVGFDTSLGEAVGDETDPGWFVVFEEPAGDVRFGLEAAGAGRAPATTWDDLTWAHLAVDDASLAAIRNIDLDSPLPDTRALVDPRSTVWHADTGTGRTGATAASVAYALARRRVRVAIHAASLLGQ